MKGVQMRKVQRGLFGNSVQVTQNLSSALKKESYFNRKYFGGRERNDCGQFGKQEFSKGQFP